MKRFLTLFLALILIATIALSASAATADLSDILMALKASYQEKLQLTAFEETLGMASMDWLRGRTAFYPESDGTAKTLSRRILAYTATDSVPEVFPEGDELLSLQEADGSFGDLITHCLSVLAMQSLKKSYNSAKAHDYILNQQNEDGSFGDSIQQTALCITVLSMQKNGVEQTAVSRGLEYLSEYRATTVTDLCWQMIGMTDAYNGDTVLKDTSRMETLLTYQTDSGSFSQTANSNETDADTTALALLAIDAVNRDASAFKRLAQDGLMKQYSFEDFKPLFTLLAVLLALAIAFWVYVFLHKKHDKTLEETKKY